ncbi:hypothetical protein N8328_00865 [Crocinitomicaceae bacterium]|nr:hypothetical protein [Crocinitomicaceae bacterium]
MRELAAGITIQRMMYKGNPNPPPKSNMRKMIRTMIKSMLKQADNPEQNPAIEARPMARYSFFSSTLRILVELKGFAKDWRNIFQVRIIRSFFPLIIRRKGLRK